MNQEYIQHPISAILPGAEILNHRFPKASDGDKSFVFGLGINDNFVEYMTLGTFTKGEEVNASYKAKGPNSVTLGVYGTAALDNLDNNVYFSIPTSEFDFFHNFSKTTPWKNKLCQEIG